MSQSLNMMDPNAYHHLPSQHLHAPSISIDIPKSWMFRITAALATIIMCAWLCVNIVIQMGDDIYLQYQILTLSIFMHENQATMSGFALALAWYAETYPMSSTYMMSSIYNLFIIIVWFGTIEKQAGFHIWNSTNFKECFGSDSRIDSNVQKYYCTCYKLASIFSFFTVILHMIWFIWYMYRTIKMPRIVIPDIKVRVLRIIAIILVKIYFITMMITMITIETESTYVFKVENIQRINFFPIFTTISSLMLLAGWAISPNYILAIMGFIAYSFNTCIIWSNVIRNLRDMNYFTDTDKIRIVSYAIQSKISIIATILFGLILILNYRTRMVVRSLVQG